MFAIFTGNPLDPRDQAEKTTVLGLEFPLGVPVQIPESWGEEIRRRLKWNNHFRVEDGADGEAEQPAVETPAEQPAQQTRGRRGRHARTEG